MSGKFPRRWLLPGLLALSLAVAAAGAYLAWWKPLALAALRLALDSRLAEIHPRISYDSVGLSGLNTLVIGQARIGGLDEPHSLLVRELRLTFSLKDLLLGRFEAPAALSRVRLDRPQLTLSVPGPQDTRRPITLMPLPGVTIRLRDGRILIRSGTDRDRLVKITEIHGWIVTGEETTHFEASGTLPHSPSHGLSLRGRKSAVRAACAVSLRGIPLEALAPWTSLTRFPAVLETGRVSADIDLAFSPSGPAGTWRLTGIEGDIRPDGATVSIPVFPGRLESVSGRIRCSGTSFSSSRLRLRAKGTEWEVGGVVNGISGESFSVHGSAANVNLSDWYGPARGTGSCELVLRGTPASPVLDIQAACGRTVLHGVACDSLQGRASMSRQFTVLRLSDFSASLFGSALRANGTLDLRDLAGTAAWTLSPCGRIPAFSGDLRLEEGKLGLDGVSVDGEWNLRLAALRKGREWAAELAASARNGGSLSLAGRIGRDHPNKLSGKAAASGISAHSLYLPPSMRSIALSISATGELGGTLARPRASVIFERSVVGVGGRDALFDAEASLVTGEGKIELRLADAKLAGPGIIADGGGTLSVSKEETRGKTEFIIAHLRGGDSELEARGALGFNRDSSGERLDFALSAVRMDGRAYPDLSASLARDAGDLMTANVSWEELLSASAKLENGGKPDLRITAAFGSLPLASLAGLFKIPAPAKSLSGSLTARGRTDRARVSASLDWVHGKGDFKGWADFSGFSDFALTANVSEQKASSWFPLLALTANLPAPSSAEAEIETHSMSIERRRGEFSVDGWLNFRSLNVAGRKLGSGNLRISAKTGRTELEGTVSGETGTLSLFPSHFSRSNDSRSLGMEFAFSDLAVGKSSLSCTRGGLRAAWDAEGGKGVAFLAGLALRDLPAGDMTADLEFRDGRWSIASPPDSPLNAAGAVSIRDGLLEVENDERTGGRWLVFTGKPGTELGISGELALPAALKNLRIRGRGLPARAILQVLGAPGLEASAEADLSWSPQDSPPMRGRVILSEGKWGDFPFARFEMTGEGTPGEAFTFSSLVLEHERSLKAAGTGGLALWPERSLELDLTVERLLLGYLKPFGFVDESTVVANGKVRISGDAGNPEVHGTLRCAVGSFSPPLGFARLYLREGRVTFNGHTALIDANLADIAGAAVLVEGAADYTGMVPRTFSLLMTAPSPVLIDGLPDLFEGSARGKLRFAGNLRNPVLRGQITIEDGQLRNPPRRKKRDPESLAQRINWDLKIKFGRNLRYALEPLGVPVANLAKLSPSPLSHIEVAGSGDDVRVYGAVHADSGPLKLFLGREIWKRGRR